MSLTGGNATESMEGMLRGAIVRGMGGLYTARTPDGAEYVLRCKKKFRRMRMSPLVGDEILFTPGVEEEHGWVEEILPRKTECLRPPVANVELLLIVVAPVPAPDLMLVDRLLVRARQQELNALLVVNKCDVDGQQLAKELSRQYARAEVSVYAVSAQTRTGMEELREAMRGALPDEVLWRRKSPYPKTWNPSYLAAVTAELRGILVDPAAPILRIIKADALETLLASGADNPIPWYGQLMTTPQTIAWFVQLNYWLEKYKVELV